MPGILIGMLLTFVLAVGAVAEAKILGRPVDHRHHPRHRDRLHLCAELAARLGARGAVDAGHRRADAARPAPARPRPHPGPALSHGAAATDRWICGLDRARRRADLSADPLRRSWPRFGKSPLLRASRSAQWSFDWWQRTADSIEIGSPGPHLADARRLGHRHRRGLALLRRAGLRPLRLARPAPVPEARAAADLLPAAGAGPGAAALVQRPRHRRFLADGGLRASGLDRAGGHAGDGDPGLRLRPGAGGGRVRPRAPRACRSCARSRCRSSGPASGRARCSPSCCPGAISRSRSTPPAPISTVPEWLYAKMVAGYTPMVPALGTFTVLAAAALLLAAGAVRRLSARH